MNKRKFFLRAIDKVSEYEFEKGHVFTLAYNAKIKPNQLHTPQAAKIVLINGDESKCFIVLQPIINVDIKGNVKVLTRSTHDQATLKEKYNTKGKDLATIKKDIKFYRLKIELGVSSEEIIEMGVSKSLIEAIKLEVKDSNPYKGGGF